MPVIKTKRSKVVADDPEPGDVVIQVAWLTPTVDGKHQRYIELPWQPISEYNETLDWAISIADQLAHPIYILPLSHRDILQTNRFDPYHKFLANMNEDDRMEVRQIIVDSCAAILRDSNTPALRVDAFNTLKQLSVVTT